MPEREKPVVVNEYARLMTVEKGGPGKPDIQQFDVKTINDAITRNMAALGADESVAAIAYVDRGGANVAVLGRIKQTKIPGKLGWTIMAKREWSGDWAAAAAIRWSM